MPVDPDGERMHGEANDTTGPAIREPSEGVQNFSANADYCWACYKWVEIKMRKLDQVTLSMLVNDKRTSVISTEISQWTSVSWGFSRNYRIPVPLFCRRGSAISLHLPPRSRRLAASRPILEAYMFLYLFRNGASPPLGCGSFRTQLLRINWNCFTGNNYFQ